jgi:hypothetical protein
LEKLVVPPETAPVNGCESVTVFVARSIPVITVPGAIFAPLNNQPVSKYSVEPTVTVVAPAVPTVLNGVTLFKLVNAMFCVKLTAAELVPVAACDNVTVVPEIATTRVPGTMFVPETTDPTRIPVALATVAVVKPDVRVVTGAATAPFVVPDPETGFDNVTNPPFTDTTRVPSGTPAPVTKDPGMIFADVFTDTTDDPSVNVTVGDVVELNEYVTVVELVILAVAGFDKINVRVLPPEAPKTASTIVPAGMFAPVTSPPTCTCVPSLTVTAFEPATTVDCGVVRFRRLLNSSCASPPAKLNFPNCCETVSCGLVGRNRCPMVVINNRSCP